MALYMPYVQRMIYYIYCDAKNNQSVKMNSRSRMSAQLGVLQEMETSSPFCLTCRKETALKREMNIPQHLKFSLSINKLDM